MLRPRTVNWDSASQWERTINWDAESMDTYTITMPPIPQVVPPNAVTDDQGNLVIDDQGRFVTL